METLDNNFPLFSFKILQQIPLTCVCFFFFFCMFICFYRTRNSQKELILCHVIIVKVEVFKTFFMEGNNVLHGVLGT